MGVEQDFFEGDADSQSEIILQTFCRKTTWKWQNFDLPGEGRWRYWTMDFKDIYKRVHVCYDKIYTKTLIFYNFLKIYWRRSD